MEKIRFFFLLLSIGEILKFKDDIVAQDIQDFIVKDIAFEMRPPLSDCRLALSLMNDSSLIREISKGIYAK